MRSRAVGAMLEAGRCSLGTAAAPPRWRAGLDRLSSPPCSPTVSRSLPMPSATHGQICYLEIPTANLERSVEFYTGVFGRTTRRRGDGATAFDDAVGGVSGSWVIGRPASRTPGLL